MKYLQTRFYTSLVQLFSILAVCIGATGSLAADFPTEPMIAIDSSGNQVAVWEVDGATSTSIQAAVFESSSWGAPTTISGSQNAFLPQLIVNDSGNTIAAWFFIDEVNSVYSIATSMLSPTTGIWSPPEVVSTTDEDVSDFQLKMNGSGQVALIWTSYNATTTDISTWASTASFGGSWGTPVELY